MEAFATQGILGGSATVRCRQSSDSHAIWDSVRITAVELTSLATVPLTFGP
jgi:hypothetical protein